MWRLFFLTRWGQSPPQDCLANCFPVRLTALLGLCGFLLYKIVQGRRPEEPAPPREPVLPPLKRRDWTVEELKPYDGRGPDGRILVAVNGKVFDMTKGKRFYGPGIA